MFYAKSSIVLLQFIRLLLQECRNLHINASVYHLKGNLIKNYRRCTQLDGEQAFNLAGCHAP